MWKLDNRFLTIKINYLFSQLFMQTSLFELVGSEDAQIIN